MGFSVSALSFVVLGYGYVLALMTIYRNRQHHVSLARLSIAAYLKRVTTFQLYCHISTLWTEITSFHGRYRKVLGESLSFS